MFVLCILTVKSKVKMRDNQDKETSTDKVRNTKESKKKYLQEHGCFCYVLWRISSSSSSSSSKYSEGSIAP
jgi:hypothetical protein